MIKIIDGDGFIIANKFIYANTQPNYNFINLGANIGIDTRYHKLDYELIDYPGEYDIQGITINCFLGQGDKLNYVIDIDDKKIGIFQSPEVLENSEIGKITIWLYTDDRILEKLDQLELDGEKIKLEYKQQV